ncbi:MAG: hypothetical protein ACI8TX_001935 [Hyphomicrobiaceae bacterium]|jgi:hypothetical protein
MALGVPWRVRFWEPTRRNRIVILQLAGFCERFMENRVCVVLVFRGADGDKN